MKVDFLPIFRAPPSPLSPSRRCAGEDFTPDKFSGEKKGRPSVPERAASLKRCKCRTGYEGRGEERREGGRKARADRKWPPLTRRDQKLVSPDTRKRRREMREAKKKK